MRTTLATGVALAALALGLLAMPALAVTPFDAIVTSSDTTVDLSGIAVHDEDLAQDNLSTVIAPLGPTGLPSSADLIAYHRDGSDELFTIETTAELSGGLVVGPRDVVRWDGANYSLEFGGAAEGVPAGARIDAISIEGSSSDLILSFDVTVDLGAGLVADDEDLVAFGGAGFSSFFDGSVEGVPTALDIDAVHSIASGGILAFSFDTGGEIGGVSFDDEDVLELTADGTWELAFDASAQHPAWAASDLDGLHLAPVPEPGALLSLTAGIGMLAALRRSRRKARTNDTRRGSVMSRTSTLLLLAVLLSWAPGAVASNGVIEINQTSAMAGGVTPGDAAGLPVTIDTRGSYVLTSDLVSTGSSETIIDVTASDVTIDLNGFTIRCSYFINPCAGTGSGDGIRAASVTNTTVRNGTVRDMPANGLDLGSYATVVKVRALENGNHGIAIVTSGVVRDCISAQNLGTGIYIWGSSIVEGSSSLLNAVGITFRGNGVLIRGNTIRSNTGKAIGMNGGPLYGGYVGNTIVSNNGTNAVVDGNQGIDLIEIGTNLCGIDTSCP